MFEAVLGQLTHTFTLGLKRYEITNHLGNVLATISDRKHAIATDGTFLPWQAEVISTSDYYPFGCTMPGREYQSNTYRFGYQGSERSPELASGHFTTFFREGDSRLGRWWSVDPKIKAWESPYVLMGNNPLLQIDPLGNTDYYSMSGKKKAKVKLIGSDKVDNGVNMLALTANASKSIEKYKGDVPTNFYHRGVVNVPTNQQLDEMDFAFSETERLGHKHEIGFVSGKGAPTSFAKGPEYDINKQKEANVDNLIPLIEKFIEDGGTPMLIAHTHFFQYKISGYSKTDNGFSMPNFTVTDNMPSDFEKEGKRMGDIPGASVVSKIAKSADLVVLGYNTHKTYTQRPAYELNGMTVSGEQYHSGYKIGSRTINYYDSTDSRTGSVSYELFKSASKTINDASTKK
jgi:RHS repeat-associated protein